MSEPARRTTTRTPSLPIRRPAKTVAPWWRWLQTRGLGLLLASWLTPGHPLLLVGRNLLYLAEPLLGSALTRLGQQFDDPVQLRAWQVALHDAEVEGLAS